MEEFKIGYRKKNLYKSNGKNTDFDVDNIDSLLRMKQRNTAQIE